MLELQETISQLYVNDVGIMMLSCKNEILTTTRPQVIFTGL